MDKWLGYHKSLTCSAFRRIVYGRNCFEKLAKPQNWTSKRGEWGYRSQCDFKEVKGMSLINQSKVVSLRCEDCAEVISLIRTDWNDGDVDYEFVIEDAYCTGGYRGFFGRLRRAWHAFWAKPISFTGVYLEGGR